jgi:SAM-dependent methyltransferase
MSGVFSIEGGHAYKEFSESGGYRTSILGIAEALAPHLNNLDHEAHILEVGAGRGRSTKALGEALALYGVTNAHILPTEIDYNLLQYVPETFSRVQNPAENLPFADESFDAVVGSQVIHWIAPEKLSGVFREAHRVLKPDGKVIHATSGVTNLGDEMNAHHFTRSRFVLEHYLPFLEQEMIINGFWTQSVDGEFVPWNPRVNPAYYRITLRDYFNHAYSGGFDWINLQAVTYMFPCPCAEIESRLTALASIEMHFLPKDVFHILPAKKVEMARNAFERAKAEVPGLFSYFDNQPLDVTIGALPDTFGEPVPVITAVKE